MYTATGPIFFHLGLLPRVVVYRL